MTPITPLEAGAENLGMFQRGKPFFAHAAASARTSLERPISIVSETYTDIEDDSSEFEEYSLGSSVRITCITWPPGHQLKLTSVRTTIVEVRQPYPLLRKCRRQGMPSCDRSSPMSGICPNPSKDQKGLTCFVHRNLQMTSHSILPCNCPRYYQRNHRHASRPHFEKRRRRLLFPCESTTTSPLP